MACQGLLRLVFLTQSWLGFMISSVECADALKSTLDLSNDLGIESRLITDKKLTFKHFRSKIIYHKISIPKNLSISKMGIQIMGNIVISDKRFRFFIQSFKNVCYLSCICKFEIFS